MLRNELGKCATVGATDFFPFQPTFVQFTDGPVLETWGINNGSYCKLAIKSTILP